MEKGLFAFLLPLLLADWVCAETPVSFPDERLKAAVEAALWISDPTPTDMLGLTSLDLDNKGIGSLVGLEYATNIESLVIRWNHVTDLSPLSGLTNLQELDAHNNGLTEIAPLSGLVNLRRLVLRINHIRDISALSNLVLLEEIHFEWNDISDISPLSGLTHLMHVDLRSNDVTDVSPLLNLPSLVFVDLRDNPLSKEACDIQIPQILASRPGMSFQYEATSITRCLRISCGPGGSVTYPGCGTFNCGDNASFNIQAEANPGFRFACWSGSDSGQNNPLSITMSEDREIRANFVSVLDTIHVDNSGRNNSLPDDPAGSDPIEDGTVEHPFDQIQEAIEVAPERSTVLVLAGVYRESIAFRGRNIHVKGFGSEDVNGGTWPVIDGDGKGPTVVFAGDENSDCTLSGFTLTGAKGGSAGAILCSGSSPTVANCLIVGNRAMNWNGAAVRCTDSNAVFINCTIADNYAGEYGAGMYLVNSPVLVVNSILWGNTPKDILTDGVSRPSICYSTVTYGWQGPGNLKADPLFASIGHWADRSNPAVEVGPDNADAVWVMGDYHLQSQAGRWDPQAAKWVQDKTTSPCIDAGDPAIPVGPEPPPNGGTINLGAYGGTAEASRSLSMNPSP